MDQQTQPAAQPTQAAIFPTDLIPEKIKEWLGSDTVFDVTQELNARFKLTGDRKPMIAFTVTKILIKKIPIGAFVKTLVSQGGLSERDALEIASVIKSRVLEPVKTALLDWGGIDISKILTPATAEAVVARTMPIEKPVVNPVMVAQRPAQRAPAPAAASMPKARVMEMAKVIDVRKPSATSAAAKPTTTPLKSAAPIPTAQTMRIEGDFSAGASALRTDRSEARAPVSAKPAEKKAAGESSATETKKEFGLAEIAPKPPAPQEIEKYEDHHPVVE